MSFVLGIIINWDDYQFIFNYDGCNANGNDLFCMIIFAMHYDYYSCLLFFILNITIQTMISISKSIVANLDYDRRLCRHC